MATSNDAAHRGQRCPGDTLALLPKISMTAGTVWVQIGQCAIPRTPFSTTGFIAFFPLTTSDAKTRAEVVAIYKLFFRAQPPATSHQPPLLCHHGSMSQPQPPKIQMSNMPEYREGYANSVQIRVNLWDFFLLFGLVNQTAPDNVNIQNFQGVYLSPQQAKALLNVLQQNVNQYETAFGEIKLEPHPPAGTVHGSRTLPAPAGASVPIPPCSPWPCLPSLFFSRTRPCCACRTIGMNWASSYPPRWISFTAALIAPPGFRIRPFLTPIRRA